MRNGAKYVVGGAFAALVGVAGVGGYNLYQSLSGDSGASGKKTGPPTGEEVRTAARDFLAAWAERDTGQAATLTDNAGSARPALEGYWKDAGITDLTLKAGKRDGTTVPFSVKARLDVKGTTSTWTYESELRVRRGDTSGNALVDWRVSVLHPDLKRGESLTAGTAEDPPVRVVDRDGTELDPAEYPSLRAVLPRLREEYGADAGGSPGVEVWIADAEGEPGEPLHTLEQGEPGKLRTTLDAKTQRAAEKAVKRYDESSVAAVKPSTGEILAFANNREDGFNAAFLGKMAPGSTMKVVTATMLMEKGLVSADKKVECPKYASWEGKRFQNLDGFDIDGGTFAESFARSCNTAFIKFVTKLRNDDLTKTAKDHFGLGRDDWKAGVPTTDGSVPAAGGTNMAAALIGQGQLQMNPLNMASVAATAKSGAFKQPVLVPAGADDRKLATARPLSPAVAADLRAMMKRTAVSGTGAKVMAPLGGDIGAKTGSAEADGQGDANSWFLGYRGDVAAAALVQQGGHGGDAAGPVVADVLKPGG